MHHVLDLSTYIQSGLAGYAWTAAGDLTTYPEVERSRFLVVLLLPLWLVRILMLMVRFGTPEDQR